MPKIARMRDATPMTIPIMSAVPKIVLEFFSSAPGGCGFVVDVGVGEAVGEAGV